MNSLSYVSCDGVVVEADLGVCVPSRLPPVLRLLLACFGPTGLVRLAGLIWTVFSVILGVGVVGRQLSNGAESP